MNVDWNVQEFEINILAFVIGQLGVVKDTRTIYQLILTLVKIQNFNT